MISKLSSNSSLVFLAVKIMLAFVFKAHNYTRQQLVMVAHSSSAVGQIEQRYEILKIRGWIRYLWRNVKCIKWYLPGKLYIWVWLRQTKSGEVLFQQVQQWTTKWAALITAPVPRSFGGSSSSPTVFSWWVSHSAKGGFLRLEYWTWALNSRALHRVV